LREPAMIGRHRFCLVDPRFTELTMVRHLEAPLGNWLDNLSADFESAMVWHLQTSVGAKDERNAVAGAGAYCGSEQSNDR
jgi:hypothetical protein